MELKRLPEYMIYALGRVLKGSVEKDARYLKVLYYYNFHKNLNLKDPHTFSEKMQWLKLYDHKPVYTDMVDKYEAKRYVSEKIGNQYIIPTLGVWDRFDDINFDELPDQFVLKCTHDSGGLVIVKDKSKFDRKAAREKIEHCLKRNYFLNTREWPYKNVNPRIIAEQYLENNEEGLHDYKVWCFNGEPLYIQYITGRIGADTYEGFYNPNWELQNIAFHNPLMKEPVVKPVCLQEMLDAARVLAKGMPFIRCDFYVLEDNSIRFGEMTFYPMSGMEDLKPEAMNLELGKKVELISSEN